LLEGETSTTIDKANELRRNLNDLYTKAASINEQVKILQSIKSRIKRVEQSFLDLNSSIINNLKDAGVPEVHWSNYEPKFKGDVKTPIKQTKNVLIEDLKRIHGEDDYQENKDSIHYFKEALRIEENKLTIGESRRKKLRGYKRKLKK